MADDCFDAANKLLLLCLLAAVVSVRPGMSSDAAIALDDVDSSTSKTT